MPERELHYRGDLTAEFYDLLYSGQPFGEDSTGWPYVVADVFLNGGGHDFSGALAHAPYSTTVLLDSMEIVAYGEWLEAHAKPGAVRP